MKNLNLSYLIRCIAMLCFITTFFQANAQVSQNGLLQVNGNRVVNSAGQSVSFAGPSLFWSNNGWGAERFYNADVVSWVKNDWNAGIIRAAMGVEDGGGYFEDAGSNKARVETIVNAAVANDMYVIIDWHSHHANEHDWASAYSFFEEMAQKYGHLDNVLYEVYNEPLQISWSQGIKPYAESIISAIRKHDPDNIVIVGTPTWSQDVDQAADDPINQANVAYTIHFYSGTHGQYLRDKGNYALSKGLALFATEWGSVNANGDGAVNYDETWAWVDWMKANGISHCNWSINDKSEGASALNPGASSTGGWSNLTASGAFAKEIMQSYTGNGGGSGGGTGGDDIITGNCQVVTLPGTVQAESFCRAQGIQTEATSDTGGGENVGYIDTGDWLEYSINVPSAGTYKIEYRIADEAGGGVIRIDQNEGNDLLGSIDIPNTGDWQNWQTISHEVTFNTSGEQNIGLAATVGGFNINYITITPVGSGCTSTGLASISLTPSNTSVQVGSSVQFTAQGTDNCGDAASISPSWSSNAPNGLFTASSEGSYTVTVSSGSISQSATVTVTSTPPPTGGTIVEKYGRLQVVNARVSAENGTPISLSGMSYFWSGWAPSFYSSNSVNYLVDEFDVQVVRAAMMAYHHSAEGQGLSYVDNPSYQIGLVEAVVDAAIAKGVYVIIDWHLEGDAWPHISQAKVFFAYMSQKYGGYDNIIYEVWNEPTDQTWDASIKGYCEEVINVIRQNDPDNLVICGTQTWSQRVDDASRNQINDSNVAYTMHFYPDDPNNGAFHREQLRDNVNTAMNNGAAIFVTEWGANYGEHTHSDVWMDFLKEKNISMCAWSVNEKVEPWSIFTEGTNGNGPYNLTAIGEYYKNLISTWQGDDNSGGARVQLPAKVEAENYSSMSGIQTEATSDAGGGENIGYFDAGDWVKYNVNTTSAGEYMLTLRVASESGGSVTFEVNGAGVATLNVPATGGWQNWQDVTATVNLPSGDFEVALSTSTGGVNVNYLNFVASQPCTSTGIASVSLSPETTSLALNASVQFTFSAVDNCGDAVSGTPTWSGNAPNGYFTAASTGQHTVTADLNGYVATAIVTVTDGGGNNGGFVVSKNGLLQVNGNKVVNKNGESVSFAGPSLFWSNNNWGAERFYNADVVSWVKQDWNAGIIRAAMGVEDGGGYFEDAGSNKARVEAVVDAAIANDMYVIIDWHSHHANEHDWAQASNFFAEMAQKYGQYDNVLYEIYNEPLQISWSSGIKPYAESIISSIRQHDPDNIIIVGTPTWSQDVDQAANDPINQSNIAYTLHYYAGTHGQSLRDKGNYALSRGLALFVTEWGSVNANGDGGVNYNETWAWVDWMKANGISHCKWSINDKSEGASFLNPGASSTGGWSNLTASGAFAKEIMLSYDYGVNNGGDGGDNGGGDGSSIHLEAENYTHMSGIEAGNGVVGYIDAGDWLAFHGVNIPSSGNYTISYKVSSPYSGGKVQLEGNSGSTVYGSVDVPNTGGWDNYQTVSHSAYLNAGSQDFGIGFPAGPFNLDWIEITPESSNGRQSTSALSLEKELKIIAYPNPASSAITLSGLAAKFNQLRVFNIDGKMKNTINIKDNDQFVLDISSLQKGVYLIQLLGNDQAKTVRFIKQ